jgi:hypothetical protein
MPAGSEQTEDNVGAGIAQLLLDMEDRMSTKFEAIEARLIAQDDKLNSLAADKAELTKQLELQSSALSLQLQMLQRIGKQVTTITS